MLNWGGGQHEAAQHRLRRLASAHGRLLAQTLRAISDAERDGLVSPDRAARLVRDAQAAHDVAVGLLGAVLTTGTGR